MYVFLMGFISDSGYFSIRAGQLTMQADIRTWVSLLTLFVPHIPLERAPSAAWCDVELIWRVSADILGVFAYCITYQDRQ